MDIKIAPSILASKMDCFGTEVESIATADWVHIDIMDGAFVPNITFGPAIVKAIRPHSRLFFDAHLMMNDPLSLAEEYIKAGADGITVHAEVLPHLHRAVHAIKDMGVKVGVALNPSTPLCVLDYVLEDIDMALIMTVNPGFGGQKFISGMLPKIKELRSRAPQLDIQVDGGVDCKNIKSLVEAGANIFVAGSSVFRETDRAAAIAALRNAAK